MTEREWRKLENTMQFIVEQQATFEANFARADDRFAQAEKRMKASERRLDRLERFADRAMRNAERRWAKADAEMAEIRTSLKSFLHAMRRSSGNGKSIS